MPSFNQDRLKEFGRTGEGETYQLSRSIYGWQIRERTEWKEQTIFRSEGHTRASYDTCLAEIQNYINAGYGVIVNDFT